MTTLVGGDTDRERPTTHSEVIRDGNITDTKT
jgi:hypothetical protein